MFGQNETIGLNVERVYAAIMGIDMAANRIIIDGPKDYQGKIIEKLCDGWVTTTGKETIEKIVETMNTTMRMILYTESSIIDAIEDSAAAIAKGLDTNYQKVGSRITRIEEFTSENAKDNFNGTKYIVVEYLTEAQINLYQYIEKVILNNLLDMSKDAEDCGLYDKDQSLYSKVNKLISEMKKAAEEKMEEINNWIQQTIDKQIEEADAAKTQAQAALDISGTIK